MIDIAFAIAFLLSLAKIGEIVLRPHQKKLLQAKMESLTLSADYTAQKYSNWLQILRRVSSAHVYLITLMILVVSVVAISQGSDKAVIAGLIGILFSIQFALAGGLWHHAPSFFDWVGIDTATPRAIAKLLGLFTFLLVLFALRIAGSAGIEEAEIAAGLLSLPLLVYFIKHPKRYLIWGAVSAIALIMGLMFLIWTAAFTSLRFTVGILWRIVEYPSGAWAAILFLLTAALGFTRVFVG